MAYSYSKASLDKFDGVYPDLVRVFKRAIEITKQDFKIDCGVRTLAKQQELFGQGRTVAQCIKGDSAGRGMSAERAAQVSKPKMPVVTRTLNSNHFVKAKTGYGHAIDVATYPVDWNPKTCPPKFKAIATAVKQAALELNIRIEWGGDWTSLMDMPHFQLDRTTYG